MLGGHRLGLGFACSWLHGKSIPRNENIAPGREVLVLSKQGKLLALAVLANFARLRPSYHARLLFAGGES